MTIYGRNANSTEQDVAQVGIDQILMCVFDPILHNLWLGSMEAYMGRDGSPNAVAQFVFYDTTSSRDPDVLRGLTSGMTVSVTYSWPTGGQKYSAPIISAPGSPSNSAVKWASGKRGALGVHVTSGNIVNVSMTEANDLPSGTDNLSFYRISGSSDTPEADLEGNEWFESTEGHLTICAVGEINSAPLAPASLAPTGNIQDLVPTFTGSFRDLNGVYGTGNGGVNRGDILNRIRIKVYTDLAGTNNIWNFEAAASPAEQAAGAFSRAYLGSALSRGTTYYWKCQVSDQFSAWSPETAMQSFTPVSLGVVTLDGNPTGKTDDLTPDFTGKWFHGDGLSTNAVQVALYVNGSFLAESGIISKTVASSGSPGTSFTITAAEATLPTLSPGTVYEYAIRGRDTNNQWSTYQLAGSRRSFTTDYAPTVPTRVSPANGAVLTTLPELKMRSTDQDDTVGTGLVASMRIKTKENFDNPTFAVDLSSWSVESNTSSWSVTASRDASVFQDAAGALKLAVASGVSGIGQRYRYGSTDYLPVVAGEVYQWVAWTREDQATDIDIRLSVDWYTSGGAYISTSVKAEPSTNVANTWYETILTATAPATAARAHISVDLLSNVASIGATRNFWLDNISAYTPQTRFIRSAVQDGDDWEYTPTGTDVPTYMQVWWDGYTYDGLVYSGGSLTVPQYMTEATFTYALGPTVTVTAPTVDEVLATNRPTFNWNDVTNQTHYRIQAWLAGTETSVWDSGWVADSASGPVQAPAGYFHDGLEYDYTVSARDNLALEGTSTLRSFSVSLTPPATLTNAFMVPTTIGLTPWADAQKISFDESVDADFWSYYITRYESGSDPTTARLMFETFELTNTTYIDRFPASGKEYVYRLYQTININGDILESDPVEFVGSITITGVSIVDTADISGQTRASFEFYEDLTYDHKKDDFTVFTWGRRKPTTLRSSVNYWNAPVSFMLVTSTSATADQRRLELKNLVENGSGVYCYRDNIGEIFFMAIDACKIRPEEIGWYSGDITLREEYYVEAVVS